MRQFIFILIAYFLPCMVFSQTQYEDHRNHRVDSLEQVLTTNPPEGKELRNIYIELMLGYSETNPEKSMEYARKCITVSIPLDLWGNLSKCYCALGDSFLDLAQYDSAMVYYNKALDATDQMRNFPDRYDEERIDDYYSKIYGSIGNFYNVSGKCPEAIAYYIKALKIFDKRNWKESQTLAYYNIGEMYRAMDNYLQAEVYYRQSDSLAYITGDSLHIAKVKLSLGVLYLLKKEYAEALQYAQPAYDYYFSHPEEGKDKTKILNLLSEIYLEGYGDDQRAEEYALKALAITRETQTSLDKAISLCQLSNVYLKRKQWRKAEQTALDALAADDKEPGNTLHIYENLAKAYANLGNASKSSEYIDKMIELQASWSNKNYQSAIREMEVKYETEKKEREIERQQQVISRQNMQRALLAAGVAVCAIILALLWYMLRLRNRRNRALSERNDALTEMNATKDKFFSIISHDLRNPAIAQRDALQLLVQNGNRWDVDRLTSYYRDLQKSADGQVELLFNLLGWAQIQTGRMTYAPETFILTDALTDLPFVRKMAANKGVAFSTQMPDNAIVAGDRNMLAMVIRNLLINAVKFTPAGGEVKFDVSPACGEIPAGYTVTISDTGIGMTKEQTGKLFRLDSARSRKGTAGEQGSGLGLIVCRELLEKHGSELHVESEEGKGSRFWFELKSEASTELF